MQAALYWARQCAECASGVPTPPKPPPTPPNPGDPGGGYEFPQAGAQDIPVGGVGRISTGTGRGIVVGGVQGAAGNINNPAGGVGRLPKGRRRW